LVGTAQSLQLLPLRGGGGGDRCLHYGQRFVHGCQLVSVLLLGAQLLRAHVRQSLGLLLALLGQLDAGCGQAVPHTNTAGEQQHYCKPRSDHDWHSAS
jgi:hypothetical protein